MALTTEQATTLRTFVQNDPVFGVMPHNEDSAFFIADQLNLNASPDFWVWKTRLSKQEIVSSVGPNSTTFNWAGSGGYIARSQGERDAFNAIFNSSFGSSADVNPSLTNVRAAFDDMFSGASAGAQNNRQHISDLSKRKATVFEKLFATGTGSFASPATMTLIGPINRFDLFSAMGW